MSYTMENGDALYARIAELEKENAKLKKENEEYEAVEQFIMGFNDNELEAIRAHYRQGKVIDGEWVNDENSDEDEDEDIKCEICGKGNGELGLTALEMDYDDTTGFHCCQGQECLRQFWKSLPQLRGRCNEDAEDNE